MMHCIGGDDVAAERWGEVDVNVANCNQSALSEDPDWRVQSTVMNFQLCLSFWLFSVTWISIFDVCCLLMIFEIMYQYVQYGDSVDNAVEKNSSVFSLVWIRWLPSAGACGQ